MHFVKTKKHSADWRKYWSILTTGNLYFAKTSRELEAFSWSLSHSILLNVNPIPPTWISLSYCPFLISTLLKKDSRGFCTIPAAANLKEYLHTSCNKARPTSWSIHISFSRKWTFSPPLLSVISVGFLLSRDWNTWLFNLYLVLYLLWCSLRVCWMSKHLKTKEPWPRLGPLPFLVMVEIYMVCKGLSREVFWLTWPPPSVNAAEG